LHGFSSGYGVNGVTGAGRPILLTSLHDVNVKVKSMNAGNAHLVPGGLIAGWQSPRIVPASGLLGGAQRRHDLLAMLSA
jgi:hypothetical protein